MGLTFDTDVLFEGQAEGEVLRLDTPISFWGAIDPVSSEVTLSGHPQCGETVGGKILVVPQLIGSSSSSAILLELIYTGMAPKALILGGRDAILPVGALVARQMGWDVGPIIAMSDPPFQTGDMVRIHTDGSIEAVGKA